MKSSEEDQPTSTGHSDPAWLEEKNFGAIIAIIAVLIAGLIWSHSTPGADAEECLYKRTSTGEIFKGDCSLTNRGDTADLSFICLTVCFVYLIPFSLVRFLKSVSPPPGEARARVKQTLIYLILLSGSVCFCYVVWSGMLAHLHDSPVPKLP
jgi:hypothetical protein